MSNNCRLCGNTKSWHDEYKPRHPFTPQDGASSPTLMNESESPPQMQQIDLPFDPILRLALVNARIITAEQLTQAEKDFRMINGGGNNANDG